MIKPLGDFPPTQTALYVMRDKLNELIDAVNKLDEIAGKSKWYISEKDVPKMVMFDCKRVEQIEQRIDKLEQHKHELEIGVGGSKNFVATYETSTPCFGELVDLKGTMKEQVKVNTYASNNSAEQDKEPDNIPKWNTSITDCGVGYDRLERLYIDKCHYITELEQVIKQAYELANKMDMWQAETECYASVYTCTDDHFSDLQYMIHNTISILKPYIDTK